jgi:hypothetical protein
MKHAIPLLLFCGSFLIFKADAQVINICTNPAAQQVMLGAYDPASYLPATIINDPTAISTGISAAVSPDSLHAYMDVLRSFKTRNTSSDTVSAVTGFGAARRWVFAKFQQVSAQNGNRLLPSYMQFDTTICGVTRHRNIFAVLPGSDTSDKSIIIIEGHMDSRSANVCDTASVAMGMEDNATGTALVLELARTMSRYSFNHTIVFLVTTGEEQGLYGGQAFASLAQTHGIQIKAVLNNDVIGGIICGHTSSAPGCPGYENIDSTQVRLFSYGGFNSFHKGLSRYIKLEYNERILPTAAVPMIVDIMTPEDRTGRGGDHIPFRTLNYPAMRFTAANEDGDADVTNPAYIDRQHTSGDSIGVDINGDGILDSFYVDFDYLARNTIINGNAAGMIGISPHVPDFTVSSTGGNLIVNITAHPEYLNYKVGVRTTTNDWDTVYTFTGTTSATIWVNPTKYIVSVASVDSKGVESLFSGEQRVSVDSITKVGTVAKQTPAVELLQNKPCGYSHNDLCCRK